jgi:hypothetical protein
MSPNLWKLLSKFNLNKAELQERAHDDGIMFDYDSSEAFEEVFWKTFDPIMEDSKTHQTIHHSKETINNFIDYKRLIINLSVEKNSSNACARYLSKNNNNLIRLTVLDREENATILLVYRNPFETARSLHCQHQKFLKNQQDNPFVLEYMNWLGHQEFGMGHKPFGFAAKKINSSLNPDQLDYWLDYWNIVYQHVLNHPSNNKIYMVHHDSMCAEPELFLKALFKVIKIADWELSLAHQINPPRKFINSEGFSPFLVESAIGIYKKLLKSKNNIFISNKESFLL